ncbi:hypothetical protein FKM82_000237 [Ascaphus truei]
MHGVFVPMQAELITLNDREDLAYSSTVIYFMKEQQPVKYALKRRRIISWDVPRTPGQEMKTVCSLFEQSPIDFFFLTPSIF